MVPGVLGVLQGVSRQRESEVFPAAFMDEWYSQLHLILEPVEEAVYNPWWYFVLSRGI